MGISNFSVMILERTLSRFPEIKTVCELGDQMLYTNDEMYGKYSDSWYKNRGIEYKCIDINGKNNALVYDMGNYNKNMPLIKEGKKYDLVTDFGFSEHVGRDQAFHIEAIYNCWRIKHELLNINGIMINANPKTGNWPGHGFNYYTKDFYLGLEPHQTYNQIELGETPAMGNSTDGWEVYCVLQKITEEFISFDDFCQLDLCTK